MGKAQQRATAEHRKRSARKGVVRIEVQAPKSDQALIRALAQELRGEPRKATMVREALSAALAKDLKLTGLDLFAADLPDEVFDGVFDSVRERKWRETAL